MKDWAGRVSWDLDYHTENLGLWFRGSREAATTFERDTQVMSVGRGMRGEWQ